MSEEKNIPQENSKKQIPNSKQEEKPDISQHFPEDSHAPKSETSNPQQETKNMEIHHHGHVHEKKKWKEYLFQFLMLFLAVFCGFLAEYQLEHKIELDKERQFIKSLITDLQDDTIIIQQNIADLKTRIILMDSLLTIISNPALIKDNGNEIYYLARYGPRLLTLTTNNKTFDQLKNSGGFRLIRNNETANKIMGYYNKLPRIERLEAIYLDEFGQYKILASKIFDPIAFRDMERENGAISRYGNNPSLRTSDTELLKEFGIYIVYINGTRKTVIPLEESLLKNGKDLISYLKNEYHLK